MKTVIIDTNFLLIPGTIGLDIFYEIDRIMHEPFKMKIVDKTLDELEAIKREQGGKFKDAANLGLKMLEENEIEIIETKSLNMTDNSKTRIVDDIIVEIADENTLVATQDKALKDELKEKGVKTIILRSKTKLEIT